VVVDKSLTQKHKTHIKPLLQKDDLYLQEIGSPSLNNYVNIKHLNSFRVKAKVKYYYVALSIKIDTLFEKALNLKKLISTLM
jgi:hypothetical protein